jgi:hypothetical protein
MWNADDFNFAVNIRFVFDFDFSFEMWSFDMPDKFALSLSSFLVFVDFINEFIFQQFFRFGVPRIISWCLLPADEKRLVALYHSLDQDGDEHLSLEELTKGIAKLQRSKHTREQNSAAAAEAIKSVYDDILQRDKADESTTQSGGFTLKALLKEYRMQKAGYTKKREDENAVGLHNLHDMLVDIDANSSGDDGRPPNRGGGGRLGKLTNSTKNMVSTATTIGKSSIKHAFTDVTEKAVSATQDATGKLKGAANAIIAKANQAADEEAALNEGDTVEKLEEKAVKKFEVMHFQGKALKHVSPTAIFDDQGTSSDDGTGTKQASKEDKKKFCELLWLAAKEVCCSLKLLTNSNSTGGNLGEEEQGDAAASDTGDEPSAVEASAVAQLEQRMFGLMQAIIQFASNFVTLTKIVAFSVSYLIYAVVLGLYLLPTFVTFPSVMFVFAVTAAVWFTCYIIFVVFVTLIALIIWKQSPHLAQQWLSEDIWTQIPFLPNLAPLIEKHYLHKLILDHRSLSYAGHIEVMQFRSQDQVFVTRVEDDNGKDCEKWGVVVELAAEKTSKEALEELASLWNDAKETEKKDMEHLGKKTSGSFSVSESFRSFRKKTGSVVRKKLNQKYTLAGGQSPHDVATKMATKRNTSLSNWNAIVDALTPDSKNPAVKSPAVEQQSLLKIDELRSHCPDAAVELDELENGLKDISHKIGKWAKRYITQKKIAMTHAIAHKIATKKRDIARMRASFVIVQPFGQEKYEAWPTYQLQMGRRGIIFEELTSASSAKPLANHTTKMKKLKLLGAKTIFGSVSTKGAEQTLAFPARDLDDPNKWVPAKLASEEWLKKHRTKKSCLRRIMTCSFFCRKSIKNEHLTPRNFFSGACSSSLSPVAISHAESHPRSPPPCPTRFL